MPLLYKNLGALAAQAKNYDLASTAFKKTIELNPTDANAILGLAEIEADANRPQQAVPLLEKAIATQTAKRQKAPENWYRVALKYAYQGKMPGETVNSAGS